MSSQGKASLSAVDKNHIKQPSRLAWQLNDINQTCPQTQTQQTFERIKNLLNTPATGR